MKVTIKHAIDLEKIPEKIYEIMNGVSIEIGDLVKLCNNCVLTTQIDSTSDMKYRLLLEEVRNLRVALGMVDQSLIDIQAVAEGYLSLLEESDTTPVPTPQAPPPQASTKGPPQPPQPQPKVSTDDAD